MVDTYPFATADDVADRWRPLTSAEANVADTLCADASALIRARFPGIDAQVDSGAIGSDILTMVCAGMVKRALVAPLEGVTQDSETVGPYNHSQSFANPLRNVFLTAADLTLILGYQQTGGSFQFRNTTTQFGGPAPIVYGL